MIIRKKGLIFALSISLLAPLALAQTNQPVSSSVSAGKNGEKIITTKDQNGDSIKYTYSKERLLIRTQGHKSGVTYTYNSSHLLAYATTDKGAMYSVARDMNGRITIISGAYSTNLQVTYDGDSPIPSEITVSKISGKTYKPIFLHSSATASSVQKIDQSIARIYETYALPADDCGESGDAVRSHPLIDGDPTHCTTGGGGGGGDGGDDGGGCADAVTVHQITAIHQITADSAIAAHQFIQKRLSTNKSESCPVPPPPPDEGCMATCDNMMDALIAQCNRIYPGSPGQGDTVGRSLCYAQSNEHYASCLAGC